MMRTELELIAAESQLEVLEQALQTSKVAHRCLIVTCRRVPPQGCVAEENEAEANRVL